MATTTDTPASQLAEAIQHLLGGVMDDVTRKDHGNALVVSAAGRTFDVLVIEVDDDPLSHIEAGDRVERETLRDIHHDKRCTVSHTAEHYDRCSRKDGHPGQHIAWSTKGGGTIVDVWPNESAPAVPGADPLAHITDGDKLTPDQWPSRYDDRDKRCLTPGIGMCTREKGHPGKHIATFSDGTVIGVWPNESAPAAPAEPKRSPGMYSVTKGDRPDPTNGGAGVTCCYADGPENWVCTRERDHAGHHVAGDGDSVLDVWS